jgi:hypothetical protein
MMDRECGPWIVDAMDSTAAPPENETSVCDGSMPPTPTKQNAQWS